MPEQTLNPRQSSGCLICGQPLVYSKQAVLRECLFCHKQVWAEAACQAGHFICDSCHSDGVRAALLGLTDCQEREPLLLLERLLAWPQVHMHGPEHHALVPCVLLTCYRNNGGQVELGKALPPAIARAGQVPGGACGYWGACGAAIGAGIYASLILGDHPLNESAWPLAQLLTSRCLARNAEVGGPRCCKRTSRLAIQTAAAFTREYTGVELPLTPVACTYSEKNRECRTNSCPFYPHPASAF